ncbi:AAA family ATPase [Candidatus Nomurabacteria bacterium]|nr:AAA family ATPase [Candidatus Nomurabacteria bacterium]
MNKIILAVVGLPGAGKTETIEYLLPKTNWPKVYFGDVTFDEMKVRGLDINEKNERFVREDLRVKFGQLHYAKKVIEKIKKMEDSSNILVESLYSWDEYLEFKNEFGDSFKVLAIYSSPDTRIARMENRPVRPLSKEDVISRDYSQIANLHQAGPIARADWTIVNEGTKENLQRELDKIIEILK